MTKSDEIRLSMCRAVQLCLHQQRDRYESNQLLKEEKLKLDDSLRELARLLKELSLLGKGVAASKKVVREDLVDATVSVMGILHAQAIRTGDESLRVLCQGTPSSIESVRDEELIRITADIVDAAEAHSEVLAQADFGEAKLENFLSLKERFDGKKAAPRVAQSERSAINKAIKRVLQATISQIDEVIDRLLYQYETSDPQFRDMYRKARRQVQYGGAKKPGNGRNLTRETLEGSSNGSEAVTSSGDKAGAVAADGEGDASADVQGEVKVDAEVEVDAEAFAEDVESAASATSQAQPASNGASPSLARDTAGKEAAASALNSEF